MADRTLEQRCAAIKVLLVDVDGVLTDGSIIYSDHETELKAFHVRDGSGLKLWARAGRKMGILTGRSSSLVARRAAELDMDVVIQGAVDKLTEYRRLLAERQWTPDDVCYVGDDLPDVPVLRQCGLAVAVADGCGEARAAAHYVTQHPGGRGAVREVVELVLRVQGVWRGIVDSYLQSAGT